MQETAARSILKTALAMLVLSAVAVRLSSATQAPARAPQSGTQPTYFVEHPDNIQPGLTFQGRWASLVNPYEGNPQRIAEGGKLFIAYNCLDCHGADGSGAIGPSL